jgi:hypothetical protein
MTLSAKNSSYLSFKESKRTFSSYNSSLLFTIFKLKQ